MKVFYRINLNNSNTICVMKTIRLFEITKKLLKCYGVRQDVLIKCFGNNSLVTIEKKIYNSCIGMPAKISILNIVKK